MYPNRVTTPPEPELPGVQSLAWRPRVQGLLASLIIALIWAWPSMQAVLSGPFVAADDARQHVFWMARFIDPSLFPGDPIADYFQGLAPAGYTALYRLLALVGVAPLLASKLVPIVLGLAATGFAYALVLRLSHRPIAGLVTAILLNHHLWRHDDLASGTPRAFVTPLFLGFMYFLVAGSWPGTIAAVSLLGLFYPQGLLIALGTLVLRALWPPGTAPPRRGLCLVALAAGLAAVLPFAGASSRYGPTIDASLAASWPEFQSGGRSVFFDSDFWRFWMLGDRSGLVPYVLSSSPVLLMGALLPWLRPRTSWLPRVSALSGEAVLLQVALASGALFVGAHLMLFRLHLPSRYTMYTLWIVAVVAAGVVIAILLEALWRAFRSGRRRGLALLGLALLTGAVLTYPGAGQPLGRVGYRAGAAPELYRFVATLPVESRIASISAEADFIPIFSGRAVLAAREFAIPYQLGYYAEQRERLTATMMAQYTRDPAFLQGFVRRFRVTHLLVDKQAFTPAYVNGHPLLRQYLAPGLREKLSGHGQKPALQHAIADATVYTDDRVILLDAWKAARLPPALPPR